MRFVTVMVFGTILTVFGTILLLECLAEKKITTKFGDVIGKRITVLDNEIDVFLSIPYAVSPSKMTKFSDPFPPHKWQTIYSVDKPPACIQKPPISKFDWIKKSLQYMSEDCLYLNIWVPVRKHDQEPFSTMVWIHGGGFNTGSSNLDVYDGGVIASLGNVIVASINYRLGAHGFFYLDKKYTPGNVAMIDQVYSLIWIKGNIGAFGGSEDKITLFGQSAGAWSITTHLVSPLTEGLFNRVIIQSGSAYHPSLVVDPKQNLLLSAYLAKELGCLDDENNLKFNKSTIDCVIKKKAEDISLYEKLFMNSKRNIISFLPQKQKPYLLNDHIKCFDKGSIHHVDVMLGNVVDEGSVFSAVYDEEFLKDENPMMNKTEAKEFLSDMLNFNETVLKPVLKQYLGNVSDKDGQTTFKHTYQVIGDWIFRCPTTFLAEKLVEHDLKVYHYTYSHKRTKNGHLDWVGVPHFEEVPFIFGVPLVTKNKYTPKERAFSRKLIKLWTSFAKTGNPNYSTMKDEWLPFTNDSRDSIKLKLENLEATKLFMDDNCVFWKNYYPK